jgi:hypothetical protein
VGTACPRIANRTIRSPGVPVPEPPLPDGQEFSVCVFADHAPKFFRLVFPELSPAQKGARDFRTFRQLTPRLSDGGRYRRPMRNQENELMGQLFKKEVLGTFGEAQLVRVDDKIHLRGGSMADRIEALEWVALFMPDEVVSMDH